MVLNSEGKNVGGRPRKKAPPEAGSIEALIGELETAKKEIIGLSALCTDEKSVRANSEMVRKIVSSIVELRLKDARARVLTNEQEVGSKASHIEDMREIRTGLLEKTSTALGVAQLRGSLKREVVCEQEEPEWLDRLIEDPVERRALNWE